MLIIPECPHPVTIANPLPRTLMMALWSSYVNGGADCFDDLDVLLPKFRHVGGRDVNFTPIRQNQLSFQIGVGMQHQGQEAYAEPIHQAGQPHRVIGMTVA